MAIVSRLLDAFFRTLDVVDALRSRIEDVRGKVSKIPATDEGEPSPQIQASEGTQNKQSDASWVATRKQPKKEKSHAKQRRPKKAKSSTGRKGSIDRKGEDLISARAAAICARMQKNNFAGISADADVAGKKGLARVLWALAAAEKNGEAEGLTAADISALLHQAAGVDAFATNIARTCREEDVFVVEAVPDGRSKRYKLTPEGRAAAARLG